VLYFDASLELHGLVCYRDYNDPTHFYYMPRSPRLSFEQGEPLFKLLVYREEAGTTGADRGGGFLTMTVDLGVPEAVKEAVKGELSSRFGVAATLSPVPVEHGTVKLSTLGVTSGAERAEGAAGPRFVEDILGAGKPSLYGDQRAVFQVTLSQRGATLMREAVLGGGASPISVLYDLDYKGLNPAYRLKIKIKFQQSYHYLRTRAQMNTLWFRTDIDREMETLEKNGSIEIDVTDYLGTVTDPDKLAAEREKITQLARDLASWSFFKPGLNPGEVLAKDRGNLTAYDATEAATANTEGFTTTASQVQAALTGVGASDDVGGPRQPGVAVRGGQAATPPAGQQAATPAGGNRPLTAVEAWNRAGRPQGAFSMRDLSQDERQELNFDLRQVTASVRNMAPQGQIRLFTDVARLRSLVQEVDLDDPFFKVLSGKVTTTAELEDYGIASMIVKLRYGVRPDGGKPKDTKELELNKAGDSFDYQFALDGKQDRSLEYQVVVNHKPGVALGVQTSSEETPWIRTTTLQIEPAPGDVANLFVIDLVSAGVDWATVRNVEARFIYKDAASGLDVGQSYLLSQQKPTQRVVLRPKDRKKDAYVVECKLHYAAGGEDVLRLEGRGSDTLVINQPTDRTGLVRVTLADPVERHARAVVELERPASEGGSGEKKSLTLVGSGASETWSYRRQDAKDDTYRYKVTAFLKDGSVREDAAQVSKASELVVGDKAAAVLRVEVMLGIDLASRGFRAMRLKLEYPDAPSWADRDLEKLYKTGSEELVWRVPMADPNKKTYRYEATWFTTDGKQLSSGVATSSDEILILDAPAR
jgi:hypothetical protein